MVKEYDSRRVKRTKHMRTKRIKQKRTKRIKQKRTKRIKQKRTKRVKQKRTKHNKTNKKRTNKKRTNKKRSRKHYSYSRMVGGTNFNTDGSHCPTGPTGQLCRLITKYIKNWCLTVVPVYHMNCTYPLDRNREHLDSHNARASASPLMMYCSKCSDEHEAHQYFDWIAVSDKYYTELYAEQETDVTQKSVQNIVRRWQCATNGEGRTAIPWRCNKCKTIWDGNPAFQVNSGIKINLQNYVRDKREHRKDVGLTVPDGDKPSGPHRTVYNGWIICSNSVHKDTHSLDMSTCDINISKLNHSEGIGQQQYDAAAAAKGINFSAAGWVDLTDSEKKEVMGDMSIPSKKTAALIGTAAGGIVSGVLAAGATGPAAPYAVPAAVVKGAAAGAAAGPAIVTAVKNPKTTAALAVGLAGPVIGAIVGGPTAAGAAVGALYGTAAEYGPVAAAAVAAKLSRKNTAEKYKVSDVKQLSREQLRNIKDTFYEFLYTHDAYLSIVPLHNFKHTPQAQINVANDLKGYNPHFPFQSLKGEFLQQYYVDQPEDDTITALINGLTEQQIMSGFGNYVTHKLNPSTKQGRAPPPLPPKENP